MPLMHGRSKKAFSQNVETEMSEGKPKNQSLAIAYNLKRKAKKMAHGGMMTEDGYQSPHKGHTIHINVNPQSNVDEPGEYAEGGSVKRERPYSSEGQKGWTHEKDYAKGVHREIENGKSYAGSLSERGHSERSKEVHQARLDESRSMPKPKLEGLADGGLIKDLPGEQPGHEPLPQMPEEQPEDPMDKHMAQDNDDMVGRIMKRMSKGGMVANETSERADEAPNEFDDLALRDKLEFEDTGSSSGDEDGSELNQDDHEDMVGRIMKKRASR